jgi:GDPmannose 4,6-dehydratase
MQPNRFVTQKIVQTTKRIAARSSKSLTLGRIDISRDLGWAPDYLEAMWLKLQQQNPEDYVIATGHTFSLQEFVVTAFDLLHLDWCDHVIQDRQLFRFAETLINSADQSKARAPLNWVATLQGKAVIAGMMNARTWNAVARPTLSWVKISRIRSPKRESCSTRRQRVRTLLFLGLNDGDYFLSVGKAVQ